MKNYIVAYDIKCAKRAYRVHKLIYDYAFGGQKSVFELLLNERDLKKLLENLKPLLDNEDSINVVEVDKNIIFYGKSEILNYNKGVIII